MMAPLPHHHPHDHPHPTQRLSIDEAFGDLVRVTDAPLPPLLPQPPDKENAATTTTTTNANDDNHANDDDDDDDDFGDFAAAHGSTTTTTTTTADHNVASSTPMDDPPTVSAAPTWTRSHDQVAAAAGQAQAQAVSLARPPRPLRSGSDDTTTTTHSISRTNGTTTAAPPQRSSSSSSSQSTSSGPLMMTMRQHVWATTVPSQPITSFSSMGPPTPSPTFVDPLVATFHSLVDPFAASTTPSSVPVVSSAAAAVAAGSATLAIAPEEPAGWDALDALVSVQDAPLPSLPPMVVASDPSNKVDTTITANAKDDSTKIDLVASDEDEFGDFATHADNETSARGGSRSVAATTEQQQQQQHAAEPATEPWTHGGGEMFGDFGTEAAAAAATASNVSGWDALDALAADTTLKTAPPIVTNAIPDATVNELQAETKPSGEVVADANEDEDDFGEFTAPSSTERGSLDSNGLDALTKEQSPTTSRKHDEFGDFTGPLSGEGLMASQSSPVQPSGDTEAVCGSGDVNTSVVSATSDATGWDALDALADAQIAPTLPGLMSQSLPRQPEVPVEAGGDDDEDFGDFTSPEISSDSGKREAPLDASVAISQSESHVLEATLSTIPGAVSTEVSGWGAFDALSEPKDAPLSGFSLPQERQTTAKTAHDDDADVDEFGEFTAFSEPAMDKLRVQNRLEQHANGTVIGGAISKIAKSDWGATEVMEEAQPSSEKSQQQQVQEPNELADDNFGDFTSPVGPVVTADLHAARETRTMESAGVIGSDATASAQNASLPSLNGASVPTTQDGDHDYFGDFTSNRKNASVELSLSPNGAEISAPSFTAAETANVSGWDALDALVDATDTPLPELSQLGVPAAVGQVHEDDPDDFGAFEGAEMEGATRASDASLSDGPISNVSPDATIDQMQPELGSVVSDLEASQTARATDSFGDPPLERAQSLPDESRSAPAESSGWDAFDALSATVNAPVPPLGCEAADSSGTKSNADASVAVGGTSSVGAVNFDFGEDSGNDDFGDFADCIQASGERPDRSESVALAIESEGMPPPSHMQNDDRISSEYCSSAESDLDGFESAHEGEDELSREREEKSQQFNSVTPPSSQVTSWDNEDPFADFDGVGTPQILPSKEIITEATKKSVTKSSDQITTSVQASAETFRTNEVEVTPDAATARPDHNDYFGDFATASGTIQTSSQEIAETDFFGTFSSTARHDASELDKNEGAPSYGVFSFAPQEKSVDEPHALQNAEFDASFGDFAGAPPAQVTTDVTSGGDVDWDDFQDHSPAVDTNDFQQLSSFRSSIVAHSLELPEVILLKSGMLEDHINFGDCFDANIGMEVPLTLERKKRALRCLQVMKLLSSSHSKLASTFWAQAMSVARDELTTGKSLLQQATALSKRDLAFVKEKLETYVHGLGEFVRVVRSIISTIGDLLMLDHSALLTVDTMASSWCSVPLLRSAIEIEEAWKVIEKLSAALDLTSKTETTYPLESLAEIRSAAIACDETAPLCQFTLQPLGKPEKSSSTKTPLSWEGRPFMACTANFLRNKCSFYTVIP